MPFHPKLSLLQEKFLILRKREICVSNIAIFSNKLKFQIWCWILDIVKKGNFYIKIAIFANFILLPFLPIYWTENVHAFYKRTLCVSLWGAILSLCLFIFYLFFWFLGLKHYSQRFCFYVTALQYIFFLHLKAFLGSFSFCSCSVYDFRFFF